MERNFLHLKLKSRSTTPASAARACSEKDSEFSARENHSEMDFFARPIRRSLMSNPPNSIYHSVGSTRKDHHIILIRNNTENPLLGAIQRKYLNHQPRSAPLRRKCATSSLRWEYLLMVSRARLSP